MNLTIRHERETDYLQIKVVNDLAFKQANEGILIEKLRLNPKFIQQLSLVADNNIKIIGHILFFPILIENETTMHKSLALAPMAVLPEFQNKGIGGQLIRSGLNIAKDLGFKSVLVLGHKDYYPRFGFTPAANWGIISLFDVPDEYFMALELVTGALKGVSGTVIYPDEFKEVS